MSTFPAFTRYRAASSADRGPGRTLPGDFARITARHQTRDPQLDKHIVDKLRLDEAGLEAVQRSAMVIGIGAAGAISGGKVAENLE